MYLCDSVCVVCVSVCVCLCVCVCVGPPGGSAEVVGVKGSDFRFREAFLWGLAPSPRASHHVPAWLGGARELDDPSAQRAAQHTVGSHHSRRGLCKCRARAAQQSWGPSTARSRRSVNVSCC